MYLCCKCKIVKPLSGYYKNKSRPNGYNGMCKSCSNIYLKSYYLNNKNKMLQTIKKSNYKGMLTKKAYVLEYLKIHPCIKCGEVDPVVLQFDHLEDKVSTISRAIDRRWSLKKLILEIKKCQVLCANCHQRKTAKDFGFYRAYN